MVRGVSDIIEEGRGVIGDKSFKCGRRFDDTGRKWRRRAAAIFSRGFCRSDQAKRTPMQEGENKKKAFPTLHPDADVTKLSCSITKQRSKSNLPNGRSVFVCRRVCCVNMFERETHLEQLKYKISSSSLSKKNNNSTSKKEETSNGGNSSGAEIMRDLKLLAEQAEREGTASIPGMEMVKPDGDANGRHPHRWREPPKWVKTC